MYGICIPYAFGNKSGSNMLQSRSVKNFHMCIVTRKINDPETHTHTHTNSEIEELKYKCESYIVSFLD